MDIKIIKTSDLCKIEKAHTEDIGFDLFAIDCKYDKEHDVFIYDTGIKFDLPIGVMMNGYPNSGLYKHAGIMANHVSVIDPGYHGTVKVLYRPLISNKVLDLIDKLNNYGVQDYTLQDEIEHDIDELRKPPFEIGEKICQVIFVNTIYPNFVEVDKFDTEYSRGENGLGSLHKENKGKIKVNLKVFITEGCRACQIMLSIVNEFIFRNKDKFEFKLDITRNKIDCKVDNIEDFPTIIVKDEEFKEIFRIKGTCSVDELTDLLIKKC